MLTYSQAFTVSSRILFLYSTSALLLATTFCFLLCHVTIFPQTLVQYSNVDLLSMTEPAQSASVYASIVCACLVCFSSV
jgi:hypothetical protein